VAQEHNVPVRLIKEALAIRTWSRQTGGNYATKLVALLRHEFGGHPVKKVSND
jgi:6-phosphogluconate dehydrogenase (decarboxylating)